MPVLWWPGGLPRSFTEGCCGNSLGKPKADVTRDVGLRLLLGLGDKQRRKAFLELFSRPSLKHGLQHFGRHFIDPKANDVASSAKMHQRCLRAVTGSNPDGRMQSDGITDQLLPLRRHMMSATKLHGRSRAYPFERPVCFGMSARNAQIMKDGSNKKSFTIKLQLVARGKNGAKSPTASRMKQKKIG